MELGLPIVPWDEQHGGLGFDLMSSFSGEQVMIGHANGIITIDLAETLDDHRERLRVVLGEPYRTMLGHFRHEVGHYYQWVLVDRRPAAVDECRALFGDERASYSDAIDRHYRLGAAGRTGRSGTSRRTRRCTRGRTSPRRARTTCTSPARWPPPAKGAVRLEAGRARGLFADDIIAATDYSDATIDEILADWQWLSLLFNRVNRAMGKDDVYPFTLVEPVVAKLGFVHRLVTGADRRQVS